MVERKVNIIDDEEMIHISVEPGFFPIQIEQVSIDNPDFTPKVLGAYYLAKYQGLESIHDIDRDVYKKWLDVSDKDLNVIIRKVEKIFLEGDE